MNTTRDLVFRRTAPGHCFPFWKRMSLGVGLRLIGLLLVGCAHHSNQTITSSFDEITSGERHTGGTFPQIYAASVNGLLPFAEPGELYFYPKNRGVLGAIGISSYTNHPS